MRQRRQLCEPEVIAKGKKPRKVKRREAAPAGAKAGHWREGGTALRRRRQLQKQRPQRPKRRKEIIRRSTVGSFLFFEKIS